MKGWVSLVLQSRQKRKRNVAATAPARPGHAQPRETGATWVDWRAIWFCQNLGWNWSQVSDDESPLYLPVVGDMTGSHLAVGCSGCLRGGGQHLVLSPQVARRRELMDLAEAIWREVGGGGPAAASALWGMVGT